MVLILLKAWKALVRKMRAPLGHQEKVIFVQTPLVNAFDKNRFLGHISKVSLIDGAAV